MAKKKVKGKKKVMWKKPATQKKPLAGVGVPETNVNMEGTIQPNPNEQTSL